MYEVARKCVVDLGADVNDMDSVYKSPIYKMIASNNIEFSKLLIAHGADVFRDDPVSSVLLYFAE